MNEELLALLVCPRCRHALELLKDGTEEKGLACAGCSVFYPIRDGIPVLLAEEAQPWPAAKREGQPKPTDSECACS